MMTRFHRHKNAWIAIAIGACLSAVVALPVIQHFRGSGGQLIAENGKFESLLNQDSDFSSCTTHISNSTLFVKTDFGIVSPGETVVRKLRFSNDSGETWKIERIQLGCSCTGAEIQPDEIRAGETAEVAIRLTAPDESVHKSTKIGVYVASDSIHLIEITVQAFVTEELAIVPDRLVLGGVRQGGVVEKEFIVRNHSLANWDGLEFQAEDETWSCAFETRKVKLPETEPQTARFLGKPIQEWRVKVKAQLDEEIEPGNHLAQVKVSAEGGQVDNRVEAQLLPVSFRVLPEMELRPIRKEYRLRKGTNTSLVLVINDPLFREDGIIIKASVPDSPVSVTHQRISQGVYNLTLNASRDGRFDSNEDSTHAELEIELKKQAQSGELIDSRKMTALLVID